MDSNRFKEPTFVLSAATFVLLLVVWLFPRQQSRFNSIPRQSENRHDGLPDDPQQFEEAISLAKTQLDAGAFSDAYDLILVSSRLQPSDPRLIDIAISFIEKANGSGNDDALDLSDDLLARAHSLIHFQHSSQVAAARKRFTDLTQRLSSPKQKPESPYADVIALLAVAERTTAPVQTRSRAAEQARSNLDEATLTRAMSNSEATSTDELNQIEKLQKQIDAAEQSCVNELFNSTRERADGWLSSAKAIRKESEAVDQAKVPEIVDRISKMLSGGFDLVQELSPYAKSRVADASELVKQTEKQMATLQRTKTWLYNQQVLHSSMTLNPNRIGLQRKNSRLLPQSRKSTCLPTFYSGTTNYGKRCLKN